MYPGERDICSAHLTVASAQHIRDLHVDGTSLRFQGWEHELKLNLMVSADCEPTSASRIRRSSESSTADCHHSKLNGTVFGMRYWPECLRGQAATYRKLAEQTDDPVIKKNLLELTSVCEEVANSIEDHLTGG